MGFTGQQKDKVGPADFAMLIGASVVTLGLVFWAFFS
jgi:hypothetical protein